MIKNLTSVRHNFVFTLLLIFCVAFSFRLWGITQQFEVWDESTVVRYGEQYLNLWKVGDFSKESWALNKEHPPFSKYFYGMTRLVSLNVLYFRDVLDQDYPVGKRYTFQRIISAFIGSLSVVLVVMLATRFFSKRVGILSGLMLCFTPAFLAHSRVATQENLVAFLTLLATSIFFIGIDKKDLHDKLFILVGIIMGFAISTKYNAFFFFILFALLTVHVFRKEFLRKKMSLVNNFIIFIPLIAILLFIAIWPWLWQNSLGHFMESLNTRVAYTRYFESANEYFLGKYPHNNPWYYFIVYYIATTPIVILVGIFGFVFKLLYKRGKYDLWFFIYFLTPFLATISPLKIDGIRYIFPIYPAASIISVLGILFIADKVVMISAFKYKIIHWVLYIMPVGILIITAFNYHPYYLDYYNEIVGGPKRVYKDRLFDFGYWGEGIREAFDYLNKHHNAEERLHIKVIPRHVIPMMSDTLMYTDNIEIADYVMINPTGEWTDETNYLTYDFPANFEVIFTREVAGVPIVQIYKRVKAYTGYIKYEQQ